MITEQEFLPELERIAQEEVERFSKTFGVPLTIKEIIKDEKMGQWKVFTNEIEETNTPQKYIISSWYLRILLAPNTARKDCQDVFVACAIHLNYHPTTKGLQEYEFTGSKHIKIDDPHTHRSLGFFQRDLH
ncbi:hypothetical protein ACFYKX_10815 [Cytobacillus sp. FJAT-54145]|uniref:Uncharacterized protein n=1 Tax=Cytobacillus spartinae TaxID=3299023 RepID=A0ABW6KA71_9BACI